MERRARRLVRGLSGAARAAVRLAAFLVLLSLLPGLGVRAVPAAEPLPLVSPGPHMAEPRAAEPDSGGPPTAKPQAQEETPASALPSTLIIPGWVPSGPPDRYERGALYGYIDGGAEIFLQYGFREAAVIRLKPAAGQASAEKEITIEIYLMETPADAFGIFSVGRAGDERVSERIGAENWVSESQAAFVKGARYVNITASGTTEADVEAVAAAAAAGLPGELNRGPAALNLLPGKDQVRASRRYVRGELAANAESPLFGVDFWGFKDGPARAFSAKYGSSGSKLVLVDLGAEREDLASAIEALFREYLADVARDGPVVSARNAAGRYFLFRQSGRYAALVLGEPDPAVARARLDAALAEKGNQGEGGPPRRALVRPLS